MQKRDLDRQTRIHDMGFKMTTASRSDVMIDDNVVAPLNVSSPIFDVSVIEILSIVFILLFHG